MFLGTYEHSIDAKGRLFIPAKLRVDNATETRFILTQGLENCLYIYQPTVFNDILTNKLSSIPVKNQQDARAFKRMLLAGAQDVSLDDMGRLLLPRPLIEHAGLKKDISILGVGERIELWSAERWKAYSRKASQTFSRLGRQLEI
jgi:MraZ protein